MSVVIKVNNLGKKYLLGKNRTQSKSINFRERITESVSSVYKKNSAERFEEFWALNDLNFKINQGDRVGVIGNNGAGKSTLLKILSRVTEPTTGKVGIKGRLASLLEVGTGFHPELTGRENIFLNGAILGMSRFEIQKKFDEIVCFADVEKFLDTPVKRYSSGMYVRLAFSVAAHLEPEILIVDEVLAVGDVRFQKKCLGKMEDVGKDGRTVIFVSHNTAALQSLCTSAILLDRGQIKYHGGLPEALKLYLSSTRSFEANLKHTNIISFKICNSQGIESNLFEIHEDIFFEIELFSETMLEYPLLSVGIHSLSGERLVTVHTHYQYEFDWSFKGRKSLRAVWKKNILLPATYRIDISLWSHSGEVESLPNVREIEILAKDIYGTGKLPDPSCQGFIAADVAWEVE